MKLFFQGTPPACCIPKSWKIENWRSFVWKTIVVSSTHHQRSHWDTITIGPEGNDQLGSTVEQQASWENSFNSLLEKHHVLNSPNQPNANPIQSVIDRGNLRDTERVFVEKGKRPRSQEIDDKRLHKELGSSDGSGKTWETAWRH